MLLLPPIYVIHITASPPSVFNPSPPSALSFWNRNYSAESLISYPFIFSPFFISLFFSSNL